MYLRLYGDISHTFGTRNRPDYRLLPSSFTTIYGTCATTYSDNGKNNRSVTEALDKEGIKWILIPPYVPHWGGIWESGVHSVKFSLRRVIGSTILTFQ